jgi:hypothetical protein
MAIETTLPSESTPEPDALPTTADDHITLTGNASFRSMATGGVIHRSDTPLPLRTVDAAILSNWDQPQPKQPRRPPFFINEPPAAPPFPPPARDSVDVRITGVASTAEVGAVSVTEPGSVNLYAKQSGFDTLMARVALLEATMAARPAGVGHNQGPDLDQNLSVDEAGIQNLIALLKVQHATAPVGLPKLIEAAQIADPTINNGQGRVDQYVKGVLTGAGIQTGKEIVKQLAHASWVHSVYAALRGVFEALMSWMHLF